MTASEQITREQQLAAMHETALSSIANELSEMVDAEHLKGTSALGRNDLRAAEHHHARATAFIDATRVIYRTISAIDREMSRDRT
jgi:fatty acid/phospholipid biosynthesis enzyme